MTQLKKRQNTKHMPTCQKSFAVIVFVVKSGHSTKQLLSHVLSYESSKVFCLGELKHELDRSTDEIYPVFNNSLSINHVGWFLNIVLSTKIPDSLSRRRTSTTGILYVMEVLFHLLLRFILMLITVNTMTIIIIALGSIDANHAASRPSFNVIRSD